jgi:hypothetical protein
MLTKVWILPCLLLVTATLIAFPLSRYLAWIMERDSSFLYGGITFSFSF